METLHNAVFDSDRIAFCTQEDHFENEHTTSSYNNQQKDWGKQTFLRLPETFKTLRSDLPTLKSMLVIPPWSLKALWVGANPITHKLKQNKTQTPSKKKFKLYYIKQSKGRDFKHTHWRDGRCNDHDPV